MIHGIFLEMRAMVYGPAGAEFLADVLRGESIQVDEAEVDDALARLPREVVGLRTAIRTEEQENDYHRAMLPALLANLGVGNPTDALLMRLVETVHEYHAFYSMYPETLPVLEELKKRGFKLAVVSNWEPSLHRFAREFELDGYFDAVVSSTEVGVAKPDPFLFGRGLKLTGLRPEQVLHAGPSPEEDVAGAIAAGIRPVWLNRTGVPTDREVLTITDLRGLLMITQKAGE